MLIDRLGGLYNRPQPVLYRELDFAYKPKAVVQEQNSKAKTEWNSIRLQYTEQHLPNLVPNQHIAMQVWSRTDTHWPTIK